jgi:paired amphipathic helix protein Sin3a
LIFGFNTFLPPGYHIECSTDDHARDIIRVTTPTGTTTTSTSEPILSLQGAEASTPSDQQPRYYQPYPAAAGVYRSSPTVSNTEPMLNMQVTEAAANPSEQPPRYYQPYPTTPTSASGYRSSPTGPLPSISSYHPSIHHAPPPPPPPPPHHHQHHAPPNAATIPPSHLPTSSSRATVDESANAGKRSPVEFNHAINYVNKIKNRFSGDPETYKQFLEILQTYQKEQKPIQEVYAQVQVLFNGANDLLAEFKQFLPDTTETTTTAVNEKRRNESSTVNHRHSKRSKTKNQDDMSDIRASLLPITPEEQHFFERIREHSTNYAVFLKNLSLYTQQMIDGNTLVDQCEPIIKEQDLVQMLKRMVGYKVQDQIIENIPQLEKPNLKKSKQHGTSYRLAPESVSGYSFPFIFFKQ